MIISLYSYQLEYTTYFALYRCFFIYGGQYTHDRTIYVIHAHFSYLLQKMGRGDFDYTLIIHNNFVMHSNVLLENIIAFVSLHPFLNSLFSFRRIAALPCIQLNFYVTEIQIMPVLSLLNYIANWSEILVHVNQLIFNMVVQKKEKSN